MQEPCEASMHGKRVCIKQNILLYTVYSMHANNENSLSIRRDLDAPEQGEMLEELKLSLPQVLVGLGLGWPQVFCHKKESVSLSAQPLKFTLNWLPRNMSSRSSQGR